MALNKITNEYTDALADIYEKTPKAVFAAIAVDYASVGGEQLDDAQDQILDIWRILHQAGIVPQKPCKPAQIKHAA